MERKKIIKALKSIKKECSKGDCDTCSWGDGYSCCTLTDVMGTELCLPNNWDIDILKEK